MQRTKSKILSILLSLVMLLSLLPTTALAAGTYHPKANEVCVDGSKYFAEPGCYYFKNGATACSKDSSGSNATYNPTIGTLTLDGYKGGSITVGGTKSKITVVLVGDNTITNGSLTSAWGGDITITSSSGGTLSISKTMDYSGAATGIEAGYGPQATGNVTITGSAEVTIDMTHNGKSTWEKAYGIFARENITISENASVDITCATPNNTTGGDYCNGLYAAQNVIIDTNGAIMIDVTNAGKDENNGYSFGVFPMGTATLTKVGNMEVKWKRVANNYNYSGGAFKGEASIAPGTHAVNEDTTNCYASYRKGKPYTVTVVNGDLAGLGVVSYAKNNGNFLAGDTVSIKPSEKKSNDNTTIPFQKWTSSGVTLESPATTADNSFPVPNKNVTVTAMHSPFVGAPVFKRTSDSSGTIAFKTVAKPDNSEFFQYVKDGSTEYTWLAPQPETTSGKSPYEYSVSATTYYAGDISNLEAGNYRMAVTLNGERYLSEPFTVNYTAATADISVRGTIKSYNPNNATTIQLMQGGEVKYTATIAATTDSGQVEQNFSFDAVAKGTYDLVVTKDAHLTYTVKNVVVGDTDLDLTKHSNAAISTITLLCGDIDGNGFINSTDLGIILKGQNYGKSTATAGDKAADLDGNGFINSTDLGIVLQGQHYGKSAVSVNFGE